jgi:hypothetical protein
LEDVDWIQMAHDKGLMVDMIMSLGFSKWWRILYHESDYQLLEEAPCRMYRRGKTIDFIPMNRLKSSDGRIRPPVCGDGDYERPFNRNQNISFAGRWLHKAVNMLKDLC